LKGAGARLGAVVPQIVSSAPAVSSSATKDSVDNVAKAQAEVNIYENSLYSVIDEESIDLKKAGLLTPLLWLSCVLELVYGDTCF
ncbi:hypothetical protein OSTOST_00949, partial [Ostertagia ostertagi]